MDAQKLKDIQANPKTAETLLPVIFNIFNKWSLSGIEQMRLLGLTNEATLYNWKKHPHKAKLSLDLLERTSYILGIFKSLEILLPDPSIADQWVSTPNDNPMFNGLPQRIVCLLD